MTESSSRNRKLRRSRNVSSFLEESTESAISPKMTSMNVVVDVHQEGDKWRRRGRDNGNDLTIELSDKERSERSSDSKNSSREASKVLRERNVVAARDRVAESRNCLTTESFDLIEEIEAPEKKNNARTREERESASLPVVKPRQRKQWNTNVTGETEDSKKPPRRRWSKDTSVIRLPETGDASPLIEESRKPVPAPRSNVRRNAFFFDNPAFMSENEEVLRIETDHRRESTKIEMRKMSDRSRDTEEAGTSGTSSSRCSSKKNDKEPTTKSRERFIDSDSRLSKTRSSEGRRNNSEEIKTSPYLEEVTDIRSTSVVSEEVYADEKKRRKKKKKQPEATAQDRSLRKRERFEKRDSRSDEASSSARDAKSAVDVETDARLRKKKRKKKKAEKKEKEEEKAETKYISVMIHRADVLESDYVNAKRPMVKVHIVKARTGDYLRNTDDRENKGIFLRPMITGKFDFKENRSMIPAWEEELVFEHDFDAITEREENSQVVILFEVVDLLSFTEASLNYERFGSEGCWNKIAWAFLKPIGTNNSLHIDKKVRLQLYKPKRSFKKYGGHKCEVYTWWQSNNRDKYPSSLFVTVTAVPPPQLEPVIYRQLALNDLPDTRNESRELSARTSDSISLPKWARLAAQSCKIPNKKIFETEASENGCFYVAFSSDGKYLACVHSEEYDYPIVVYEVETGKIHVRFLGHKNFVYSLNWCSDSRHLLSASADQTARIWDVRSQIVQHIEMLPHPSYVYCANYGPDNAAIVATGCCDRVARIWANDKQSQKRELSQELEGHGGFVGTMVFQKNGNLITADSAGVIIVWMVRKNSRMPCKKEWCVSKKIEGIREIEGVAINTIALHPLGSRLLVHSRNNGLRMLDLATGVVLQKYNQLDNQRIQSKACISPCGSLVLCGGEDSVLNIWNLETGKHVAKYTNERYYRAITCVDYHPYDHVLAFSNFGSPTPVQVLRFDKDASGDDVGLKIAENELYDRDNEPIESVIPPRDSRQSALSFLESGKEVYRETSNQDPISNKQTIYGAYEARNSKRTNRLHQIIEKIDVMLSIVKLKRTRRPTAVNIEMIASSNLYIEANREEMDKIERFGETYFSVVNERSSSFVESFDRSLLATERRRMAIDGRPKSAKELATDKIKVDQDQFKSLSDSAANSTKVLYDPFFSLADVRGNVEENSDTIWPVQQDRSSDSTTSIVISIDKTNIFETPRESTSDSAGTYIIDMTKPEENVEKNVDSSRRLSAKRIINVEDRELTDFVGDSEMSDSSAPSNATFVIENKKPVPRPRHNLQK